MRGGSYQERSRFNPETNSGFVCGKLGHRTVECRRDDRDRNPPRQHHGVAHRAHFADLPSRSGGNVDRRDGGANGGSGGPGNSTFTISHANTTPTCANNFFSLLPPPPPPPPPTTLSPSMPSNHYEIVYTLFPRKPIPSIVAGFVADSGTSSHIANDPKLFADLSYFPPHETVNIITGGGPIVSYKSGIVLIPTSTLTLKLTN
eukprot:32697-Chlamydomonas_euryale.AAC.1